MAADIVINPDSIQTLFNDLDTRKTLLITISELHKTLTSHFTSIHQTLSQKSQALDSRIGEFGSLVKTTLESLQNREDTLPELESTLASRVEEQRASAVQDIEAGASGSSMERTLLETLKMYCKRMDYNALVKLLLAKRKESVALRADLTTALEECVDSTRLVLDAVEEFVRMKVDGKVGMADRRWACGILIQVAIPIPVVGESASVIRVGRKLRGRAVAVFEKWKGVLGGGEGSGGIGAGEATMFLQMLIGFGLKEKFEKEFLKKLVVEFASRRDMPKLAVALGFGEQMGDIIDELVKSGKEIEAVYFASEAGLTDRFNPVGLLRSCLRNCRNNANKISRNGNFSTAVVEKANSLELDATKAIIKCVDDHKLESQFSVDSLKRRVTQLEKAKADKKKSATSTSKPSNKRAHGSSGRGGGPSSFRPPKAVRFSNVSPSFRQKNPSQSHQVQPARFSPSLYNYANQSMYEAAPATASYGAGYGGARIQSPGTVLPHQYSYAPQDVGPGGARAAGAYGGGQGSYSGQANYGSYDYGAAVGPPTYPSAYQQ